MDLFFYLERASPLHRLHPVTKIALLGGTCALALVLARPLHLLAPSRAPLACSPSRGRASGTCGACASSSLLADLRARRSGRSSAAGRRRCWLWMTREGLAAGVVAALRIDRFLLAGVLFLSATRNEEIVAGLRASASPTRSASPSRRRCASPRRSSAPAGGAARRSWRAASTPTAGSLARAARNHVPLLVPTFLTTIRMTHHLAMSLEARGFGLQKQRTSLLETHFGVGDLFVLLLLAALLAAAYFSLSAVKSREIFLVSTAS